MGTTLSANPLQFAAMRATLEEVMTDRELRPYGAAGAAARRRADRRSSTAIACPGMWRASAPASSSSARPARCRNGGEAEARACAGARGGDPCRAGQSRRADRAVPQHDADLAGHHARARSTGWSPPSARLRQSLRRETSAISVQPSSIMTSPSGSTPSEAQSLSRRPSRDRGLRHRADRRQRRRARQDHPPARADEHLRGRPASADLDPRPRHHRRGRPRDRADLGLRRRRPARLADPRHAGAAVRHQARRAARC